MRTPIFLQADDGLTWWTDLPALASSLESPDIEAGIYQAWDADGQRLSIAPVVPVKRGRLLGFPSASISCGNVSASGVFEQDALCGVLAAHLRDACDYSAEPPGDLPELINLLCRLQPQSR